jgi:hypothetical protein
VIVLLIGASVAAFAVGVRMVPRPLPPFADDEPELETVPLPVDLPAPVARWYRELYGDRVPLIDSAVVSGRATLRLMGLTFNGRFRFIHEAGVNYRHYLDATLFGLPLMRVNEWFIGGRARLELPFGVTEDEPKVDQAANLGLWAESIWLPALFVTDARVRWEAVDDETALLIVPADGGEEHFVVRFDPDVRPADAVRGHALPRGRRRGEDAVAQPLGRLGRGRRPHGPHRGHPHLVRRRPPVGRVPGRGGRVRRRRERGRAGPRPLTRSPADPPTAWVCVGRPGSSNARATLSLRSFAPIRHKEGSCALHPQP